MSPSRSRLTASLLSWPQNVIEQLSRWAHVVSGECKPTKPQQSRPCSSHGPGNLPAPRVISDHPQPFCRLPSVQCQDVRAESHHSSWTPEPRLTIQNKNMHSITAPSCYQTSPKGPWSLFPEERGCLSQNPGAYTLLDFVLPSIPVDILTL